MLYWGDGEGLSASGKGISAGVDSGDGEGISAGVDSGDGGGISAGVDSGDGDGISAPGDGMSAGVGAVVSGGGGSCSVSG